MDIIRIMAKQFARIRQTMRKRRGVLTALACFVVFVTTYSLILPAITLDEDSAGDQSGINTRTEQQAEEQDQGKNSQADNQNAGSEKTGNEKESASDDQKAEKPDITNAEENSIDKNADAEKEEETAGEERDKEEAGSEDTEAAAQTAKELEYEGDDYTITVKSGKAAGIPEGAELSVKEVKQDTDDYQKYLKKSAKKLGVDDKDDISFARFFDIEIKKDGEKIEPDSAVQVSIEYDDPLDMQAGSSLNIVHFASEGTEVIEDKDIDINKKKKELTYKQDSFSVTGTVVTGGPRNGQQYMMIVEYDGKNYLINNDGSLVPVEDVNANQISTDSPMLWTYYYQYGAHFRFASEASGFNSDQTASGFYYRYLDPKSETGLTEEDAQHPHLEGSTQINYNNGRVSSTSNNDLYIGVSNEGGTLHITGQNNSAHAARITLYSADQVRPSDPANHTVNHIDISISGTAQVDVPLAYGIYYYKDGNDWKKIIVGRNVVDDDSGIPVEARYDNLTEKLEAAHVGITADDMKKAKIIAKDKSGNEVDNAFYITGYSANETTQWSTDQVRIEGSFKVSTIDPVNWWEANSADVRHRRKNNPIEYTVEATKDLELPLTYTDGSGRKFQLYQSLSDQEPMTIKTQVPMSASFDYWTYIHGVGNECPPLQPSWGYTQEWQDGGIHPWGISGMDFVLKADVVNVPANILALEITKKVVDENGRVIDNLTAPINSKFEVYRDKPGDPATVREVGSEIHDYGTYSKLHDHNVQIGTTGTGHRFDYNVTGGMYYVRESRDGLPTQITTKDGKTYNYIRTEIKTEYSYRANQYRVKDDEGNTTYHQMHETSIASSNANLNSIPEVLGEYKDDNGDPEKNEFLEFYFYNVYSETETPPPPEPVEKTFNIELDKNWQNGDDTTAPRTGTVTFKLHQIRTQNNSSQTDAAGSGYPKTIVISAADDWKATIPNLPWYESDTDHSYERTYKYYLEEVVSQSTGEAAQYGVPSFDNGFGSINKPVTGDEEDQTITVKATNKTGNVIRIQKRWINIDPDTAPDVRIQLWRQELDAYNNPVGSPQRYGNLITLDDSMRVMNENWWEYEIPLPSETPGTGGHQYAYFISENNIDGTNNSQSDIYLQPRYFKLTGDQVIDDYEAYNVGKGIDFGSSDWAKRGNESCWYNNQNIYNYVKASDAEDSTLIVMNAPKDSFQHVKLFKTGFRYNSSGQLVQASSSDVNRYAVGLQVYQRLKQNGAEWAPFANPFYISTSTAVIDCGGQTYINEDNPFKFEYLQDDNGVWKWQFLQYDGIRNGFPRYGLVNGHKVEYEYEIREFGVYTGDHASRASDLTRVYDYTSAQNWYFDEQHKDAQNNERARGVNVAAGKLKVTKQWQGGSVGSKIYFKLYRGDEDITPLVIADPDSFHLTEHQVIDDGTHKALIVRSDGTNWEEMLIEGLPVAPANGGSPYQYSIKEIGYSEADGTDCWDGENIIESDGSTRQEPNGTGPVVVHISELLTGYVIDDAGNETLVNGRSAPVTVTGTDPHSIQVNNTHVEKYKDFKFTKVWEGSNGESITWPSSIESITVDLYANDSKVVSGIRLSPTPPQDQQSTVNRFTWDGITYRCEVSADPSGKIYSIRIPDLPARISNEEATYTVKETAVSGYETGYGHIAENAAHEKIFEEESADSAADGKTIRNKKESREYEVVIVKSDTGNTTLRLGGAVFDLYAGSSVENDMVKQGETPIRQNLTTSSEEGADKGKVSLGVLGEGTYYLFETKAPAGYEKLDKPVKITVSGSSVGLMQGLREETVNIEQDQQKAELTVMNTTGVELPHTGGSGSRMFYILGALLTAAALSIAVLRRRRAKA